MGLDCSATQRCLCALEALMREDIASADHLQGFLPDALRQLQSGAADRLVQAKASKVLIHSSVCGKYRYFI